MESNTKYTPDSIVQGVIDDLVSRAEIGLKKYNTTMDREDLVASDWVQHAYEEVLDMALYLKRLNKDMLLMEEQLRGCMLREALRQKAIEDENKKKDIDQAPPKYAWHR